MPPKKKFVKFGGKDFDLSKPVRPKVKGVDTKKVLRLQREHEQREREDYEGRISNMAKKTQDILDDVQDKASNTLADAKETNSALDQYYKRERRERLASSRPGRKEHSWLRDDEENEARQYRFDENDRVRKEKFKDWHRKKNEELRRKLTKVYGNSSSLQNGYNGKSSSLSTISPMKASTPKISSDNSPRPKSMMSTVSGSRAQYSNAPSLDQELSVHMTEFGMRRSWLFKILPNWTPKFDGDVRPRAGLVFVEPRIYDEFLREETQIKNATALKAQSRSTNLNNLTIDDDNTVLEPVEIS